MRLTFHVEPLREVWNQVMELASAHWKETEGYRHGQPFSPSFDRYNQYDVAGWFRMFTARQGERMVGYAAMYITPSMHTQKTIATEDTWFLVPECRRGRNAIEFYNFVEAECRKLGVVEIGMTAKMTNGAGRVLEYLGYKIVSQQYSKNLTYNPQVRPIQDDAGMAGSADSAIENSTMDAENVLSLSTASP